jgi:hypothetical protein
MNQNPEKTNESGEAAADNQAMPGGVIRVDEEMINVIAELPSGNAPTARVVSGKFRTFVEACGGLGKVCCWFFCGSLWAGVDRP